MDINTGYELRKYGYSTTKREITKEEKRLITCVFHNADDKNEGYLTREDLKIAVAELFGYTPSKYDADQIIQQYGEIVSNQKVITLKKFSEAMEEKFAVSDEDENIRHSFMAFDTQCKGFLTIEELRKAAQQVAPHICNHSLETAFRELDRDCDGRVSYKDFDFMMKYNTTELL